jgi:hypothetical protein
MSADDAVLITENGRVVQTAGFPENLKNTKFTINDPVNRQLHLPPPLKNSFREIDSDFDQRYGIPIYSEYESVGPRDISIAGINIKTILVKEYNIAKTINWNFTNYYWVDKFDGFVWKSRQKIARSFPPIEIEILKPAL